jgi:diacylglycerol kinase family enzyme
MIEANIYDMPSLVKNTIEGEVLNIDYGVCNGMRFINCLCMGIDADVNARVCEVGKQSMVPKKFLYITSALHVIRHLNPLNFKMKMDGEESSKQGLLAAVMNGRKYGGGFTPTPNSDFNDGVFDVCLVKSMKLPKLIPLLPKYFKGTHTGEDVVEMFHTKEIAFQFEQPVNVCLDGEMFQMTDIDAKIVESGLMLKLPKGCYHEHRK